MTVKELIEELKTANPNAEVIIGYLDYDGYYCECDNVDMVNDENERVVIGKSPL